MPASHNRATSEKPKSKPGKADMSSNAPAASHELTNVEQAVLRALRQQTRQMDELLDMLRQYSSASVKSAVWRLIDRGDVTLEPDRSLKRAA